MKRFLTACAALACAALGLTALYGAKDSDANEYVNSLRMKMVRIPAGSFRMGNNLPTDPATLGQPKLLPQGDYDETPVHDVTITYPFYISETEITVDQYNAFRMDYQDAGRFPPYATGMSWDDAVAFCDWLSKKEKRNYRLPTEAEWEYAARAGSQNHFSSGDRPPAAETVNKWGVKNMHTGAMEWVHDWYGPYPAAPQTDPVGPASGFARVVRGGGIMGPGKQGADGYAPYYRRSANRASVAPTLRGINPIGFRIVEAALPKTAPLRVEASFPMQCVKQDKTLAKTGPDPRKPWFHQRPLLPIPPEDLNAAAIRASGIAPGVNGHNHSAGATVAPNGDILWIAFSASSSSTEYMQNTTFVVSRLRFGSDTWDYPEVFYDFADVNDQSALLWNDTGTLRFFGGGVGLANVPFRMQSSTDNGATWSAIRLPVLSGPVGGFSPQPITSAFRMNGATYLATDAVGGESMLWESKDEGVTWSDTLGRTAGRHTAFARLKDGSLLGLGGKNTDIDGYMPQTISRDGGHTWSPATKTPFPALGSNQRPTLIRLASGRLFVASDYQSRTGKQPAGLTQHGAFVALSDDEGRTWKMKKIPGTLPHEAFVMGKREYWNESRHGEGTLGYTIAAQAPNGLIHVITSMNHPSQHFELNEAWILSSAGAPATSPAVNSARRTSEQHYPGGALQARWSGVTDASGRYLLDGPETWSYQNGAKQYEVTWHNGRKTERETYWSPDGAKEWEWDHRADGASVWTQYWPNGKKKHESTWRDGKCVGTATAWSFTGNVEGAYEFADGALKR